MNRLQATIRAAFFTTAGLALSATALAQTAPPASPPASQQAPVQSPPPTPPAPAAANPAAPAQAAPVTDDRIHSFALAYLQVQKVQKEYAPGIQAANGDQKAALKQKADQEMAAAVKAQGLDSQAFNTIAQTANGDEQLRQKIGQEVAKIQASKGAR